MQLHFALSMHACRRLQALDSMQQCVRKISYSCLDHKQCTQTITTKFRKIALGCEPSQCSAAFEDERTLLEVLGDNYRTANSSICSPGCCLGRSALDFHLLRKCQCTIDQYSECTSRNGRTPLACSIFGPAALVFQLASGSLLRVPATISCDGTDAGMYARWQCT